MSSVGLTSRSMTQVCARCCLRFAGVRSSVYAEQAPSQLELSAAVQSSQGSTADPACNGNGAQPDQDAAAACPPCPVCLGMLQCPEGRSAPSTAAPEAAAAVQSDPESQDWAAVAGPAMAGAADVVRLVAFLNPGERCSFGDLIHLRARGDNVLLLSEATRCDAGSRGSNSAASQWTSRCREPPWCGSKPCGIGCGGIPPSRCCSPGTRLPAMWWTSKRRCGWPWWSPWLSSCIAGTGQVWHKMRLAPE